MSHLPENASFEELVADAFVSFRGAGLMLSPLDAELVAGWAATGVPAEVVIRGIRHAAEKALFDATPGHPVLRSVRACRGDVDREIKKHQRLTIGRATGSGLAADDSVPAAQNTVRPKPKLLGALRRQLATYPRLAAICERLELGPQREGVVVTLILRALPWELRRGALLQARALEGHALALSPPARKRSRRFHREAVVRRLLELPAFW